MVLGKEEQEEGPERAERMKKEPGRLVTGAPSVVE